MPGKMAVNLKFSHFVSIAVGLVSVNVFLVQTPQSVVAVAPGTPSATSTPIRAEAATSASAVNPEQTMAPSTPAGKTYVVQAGDNIYRIAQKVYGESAKYNLILEANNLTESARIFTGMVLKIPYAATPTLTVTPSVNPTVTATVSLPTATETSTPSGTQTNQSDFKVPIPGSESGDGDQPAIIAMLTVFTTATLAGSSIISALLAFKVYSNARRVANQHAMARRVRPPLRRLQ
jgi:LysM repeat protein